MLLRWTRDFATQELADAAAYEHQNAPDDIDTDADESDPAAI